jgi:hypothetical protein
MSQTHDHWKTVLQRGAAALDFRIIDAAGASPALIAEPAPQKRALPVMVYNVMAAAAVVDGWVAGGEGEVLIDRPAILARWRLLDAKAAEPPGSLPSPFSTGYGAAYRLELTRLLWLAIIDHPSRRLEALAAAYAPAEPRIRLV